MRVIVEHADAGRLATAVAERIIEDLREGLSSAGRATLALAGGSTPVPVYRLLGQRQLDWSSVRVVPTDERWVDSGHADRNSSPISASFGTPGPELCELAPAHVSGDASTEPARQALANLSGPFDHVLLGMGADGHFASLFPGTDGSALDPKGDADAVVVVPDPMPASGPHPRLSLTLSRLLRARRITLALTGADKRDTLERAARADADPTALPVAALLRAGGDRLAVHWSPREGAS